MSDFHDVDQPQFVCHLQQPMAHLKRQSALRDKEQRKAIPMTTAIPLLGTSSTLFATAKVILLNLLNL